MTAQMKYIFQARDENDTKRLANELAMLCQAGSFIALDGDLGAGKTTFSQAIACFLGVKGVVNSPTYTIIKEYKGSQFAFYHMDVYRLSADEAGQLGMEDYFYGDGITIVEWASRIEVMLPTDRLSIFIESTGLQQRCFHLMPSGTPYEAWCAALKENEIIQ